MTRDEIKKIRNEVGKYLHEYYLKYGEKEYDKLIKNISPELISEYGEPFNASNLRIMEAEYLTFNTYLRGKNKSKSKKTSS